MKFVIKNLLLAILDLITVSSLHVGSLLQIMTMLMQKHGHRPIVLLEVERH